MSNVIQFPTKVNETKSLTKQDYFALKKALDGGAAQFFELSPHEKFDLFQTAAKFSLTAIEIALERGKKIERLEKQLESLNKS